MRSPGVHVLRSVLVSVLADDGFIFGSDRLKIPLYGLLESALAFQCSGVVSDDGLEFSLFGCRVCSDRRRVSGRVPCRMVSESRKMFYKSVSDGLGCISSGSLQGLRQ